MSNIKIQDVDQRIQYTATSGQTAFSIPFPFFANSDIVAYSDSTLLVLTTNYTLTGADNPSGGTLTLVVGASCPLIEHQSIVRRYQTSLAQI